MVHRPIVEFYFAISQLYIGLWRISIIFPLQQDVSRKAALHMYFGPQVAKCRNGMSIIWRAGRPSGWALPRILVISEFLSNFSSVNSTRVKWKSYFVCDQNLFLLSPVVGNVNAWRPVNAARSSALGLAATSVFCSLQFGDATAISSSAAASSVRSHEPINR